MRGKDNDGDATQGEDMENDERANKNGDREDESTHPVFSVFKTAGSHEGGLDAAGVTRVHEGRHCGDRLGRKSMRYGLGDGHLVWPPLPLPVPMPLAVPVPFPVLSAVPVALTLTLSVAVPVAS